MTYILQNFLAQAQLEILLARLESWGLGLKTGVLASIGIVVGHSCKCKSE